MNTLITKPRKKHALPAPKQPRLETQRLILRPLKRTDAPVIQRLAGDFAVADTTLNVPHPYPDGAAEDFIKGETDKFRRGRGITFAITMKSEGQLMGIMGLNYMRRFHRAELGYWIARPFWNRGYATEAGKAVVRFAFTQGELHKVEATYFSRNPASGRVMEKLGMCQEGVLRDHIYKWNRFEDLVVCGVINPANGPA